MNGGTDAAVTIADDVAAGTDDAVLGDELTGAAEARLLRELCHDLIEPVASIKLLVQVACTEAKSDSLVLDRLGLIADEAGRIADICGQVLDQPRRIEPIRLDVLAAEAVASARLRHRGVIEAVADPVTLYVHPAVVVRILNNLLTNACRAAGAGGHVRVRVALDGGQARLAVANSGDGLRGENASRTSLGLQIVCSLALSCGGTVQMGASDLGGLCVAVTLPCLRPATQRGRIPVGGPGPGQADGGLPG